MTIYSLSPEQVRHYQIEGYVVAAPIFGRDDLAKIDDTIRELTDRALVGEDMSTILELEPEALDGQRVARRIFNPYDQPPAFRSLAEDSRLLDRIGGPPPLIPTVGKYASLYELQAQTKMKLAGEV
jgi:hypothetical protein